MAIEILPDDENDVARATPRISFSYDLLQPDVRHPISPSVPADNTFDFCFFRQSPDQESSSADELFSDGKILPVGIKQSRATDSPRRPPVIPPVRKSSNQIVGVDEEVMKASEKQKLMWKCNRGGGGVLSPTISRSYSDGSYGGGGGSQRSTRTPAWSDQKQKQPALNRTSSQGYCRKSTVIDQYSPVLNVAPASLFGLASIFSGGKNWRKKKH